jgi:hypothetical protein
MLKNMLSFIWLLIRRPKLLPKEFVANRFRICQDCVYFADGGRYSCSRCRCTLCGKPSRFCKTAYFDQECPEGYWGKIPEREF